MSDELTTDLRAFAQATDRVPSLTRTTSALEASLASHKEPLMSKIFRRPLVAIAILLLIVVATPVAYALATDRFHLFVDADQPTDTINSSLQQQARAQGARADVSASKDQDGVHVQFKWNSLKEMFADCLDGSGAPRAFEASVAKDGQTTTTALDPDKHRKLMAVLVEADQLADQLHAQQVSEDECTRRVLALIRDRLTALGVAVPAATSDAPADQVRALEQAVQTWLSSGTPFQFHVGK
jgi:hypothetical protein